ncbi:MAG TPA: metalloregulator ArsR/SmtB family transcription factor [Polyangiales bacterium]|nr:metalloregulator ArsR/SmtB family transcription factor [Polyangiales bacterium]
MVESRQAQLDLIFHALSDPTRRAILQTLTRRQRSITELAQPFGISLAAVSKHVKVLERARLVQRERRGSFSYLRLHGDALLTAQQWIDKHRTLWEDRLENLKNLLEKE